VYASHFWAKLLTLISHIC